MTLAPAAQVLLDALTLPADARVDARVPKKLLIEQGAPTAADKRAIQGGIDELQWIAACKPTTIAVPSFSDDVREYLEIAVVACAFRSSARAARLIELIHRAIPYPVILLTVDETGLTISAAHKRRALNDAARVVLDGVVSTSGIKPAALSENEQAFLQSVAIAKQPRRDLYALYEGWIAQIEALNAARLSGAFASFDDAAAIERRRQALDASNQITRQITTLRAQSNREKQINRRVDLNVQIQRLEEDLARQRGNL